MGVRVPPSAPDPKRPGALPGLFRSGASWEAQALDLRRFAPRSSGTSPPFRTIFKKARSAPFFRQPQARVDDRGPFATPKSAGNGSATTFSCRECDRASGADSPPPIVVDRVVVPADLREPLDVRRLHFARALRDLSHARHTSRPHGRFIVTRARLPWNGARFPHRGVTRCLLSGAPEVGETGSPQGSLSSFRR